MTKREFTAIILKLIGVATLVNYISQTLMSLTIFFRMIQHGNPGTDYLEITNYLVIPFCLYIILPALLILKSNWVASRLIKNEGEFNLGFTITKEEILTVLFCCIGLITMIIVVPKLTQNLFQILFTQTQQAGMLGSHGSSIIRYSALIGNSIQMIIGLALFLQAKGLTNLWYKLRDYKGPIQNSED